MKYSISENPQSFISYYSNVQYFSPASSITLCKYNQELFPFIERITLNSRLIAIYQIYTLHESYMVISPFLDQREKLYFKIKIFNFLLFQQQINFYVKFHPYISVCDIQHCLLFLPGGALILRCLIPQITGTYEDLSMTMTCKV